MAPAGMNGEKGQSGPQRQRRLSVLLALVSLLAVLVGWYFLAEGVVSLLTDRDIDNFVLRSRDSSDQIATNLARNLQDDVRRLSNLPEALAGDPILRAPLVEEHAAGRNHVSSVEEANDRLQQLADQLELDVVYLLDAKGLCIASSNYQSDKTIVGTNLGMRQYFSAMQNGSRGRQFAFGSATGIAGMYFSAPINKDGLFAGGLVIKRNIRSLFHLTTRNAAFLVDEYGVVVATTIEQALWHYLPDSSATGLGTDFLQARYRQSALVPLDIRADHSMSVVSLVYLMQDPMPSLMTARPIGDSGLRLVYFTPVPDLMAMRQRANITFWLVFVSGCLILTLVVGAVNYLLQTRRRVTALRFSYQKLAALSRELAAEKETAQAADQAKSRFLATMSHELRTPFSGILGMVEMLRTSKLPDEAIEQVGLLERSARALLGLLNDVLDFSKIDAGQLRVESVPFDLQTVITDLGQIQAVVASAKGIKLTVEGIAGPLIGRGDPSRLRQILNNFLSNAIKFTAMGGVRMSIKTLGSGPERQLRITVTDSGPGMSAEVKEHMFQPFFQADASTTRRHGGTGLGLAISKRIAEAMGGTVGVDSEPGHGSTFWLETPFAETDGRPVNVDNKLGQAALPEAVAPGGGKRILLADDDEVNRLVIGGMLRRVGHEVVFALDGRQAVREVDRQDFDMVIMDMHMPEMDGVEATRAIRTLPSAKAYLPIVGLTADAIVENRQQYLSAGLNDLLTKPISATDLVAVIRRFTESVEP